jgi:predicted NUDIX family NTP pyrophosphohydrolase
MKPSAGILVFKPNKDNDGYLVLLAHPGGPLWGHKHKWTLPKGVLDENEDHLVAAYREFEEEIGMLPPRGKLIDLGSIKDGAKTNFIWAIEGDIDLENFSCNTFTMEWPLHSGIMGEFPENDRAEWFTMEAARQKLFTGQVGFIDRLAEQLGVTLS